MFNCIANDALASMCIALGLIPTYITKEHEIDDVYIVYRSDLEGLHFGYSVPAFKLSDYLLAVAPIRR